MKKSLLFFALVLSSYGTIHAQVTTSSMSGVVSESSGQTTAGASIKATHMPSGTSYSGSANAAGRFNLANMRVGGPYRVEVTYVGQNPIVYEDVYLQLGQPFVLNPIFGSTANEIDEVAVVGTRRSQKNGTATVVNRKQIENIPTISRSVNDLTRLTPQANGTAIGGGNYRGNNFTVDGANFNNQFGIGQNIPANGSPISIDAIEQIVVNVTPFDVRQSGFTGAAVNAVTRSGRNDFFGSAFYTGRSDQQQGTRVKDKQVAFNEMKEKQYGFSLGGPIIKDKLFFFVNIEQNKTTEPGPTKIADNKDNPLYGKGNTNIARPTYQFLDEVRDYLIKTYNYDPGRYQGYSNKSNNDKVFAKIDWNISDSHKINFRYNQVKAKTPNGISTSFTNSGVPSGLSRTGSNTIAFENSNYFQESNLYSGVVEYSGKWGNTNNTVRVAYVNQNDPRSSNSSLFPLVDVKEDNNIITTFGYEPFTFGNLRDVKTLTAYYDGSWVYDNHEFTYGAQYETSTTKNGFQRFGAGYYLYNSWDDFVNGNKAINYALTYPLTADGSQAFPSFRFDQLSFFLQDQYTVNSKLRLMGGIRLEVPMYPDVSAMKTHPLVEQMTFADGLKLNTGAMPKARLMASPRIGFNYDVFGDRTMTLRGGTGIFTGRIPFVWIVAQSGDSGMLQATKTFTGSEIPEFNPDITANYPKPVPAAGTSIPSSISAMDENLRFPSTWKSSLAVDYTLPFGIQASLEGIYTKDINAVVAKNVNLVEPTRMEIEGYPDHRFIYPNANGSKYIYKLDKNGLVDKNGTGAFSPTYMTNAKGGHYYSVTAQLQKNNWNGFSGSVSYTYSAAKNFGDGAGDQVANLWSIPPTNTGNPNIPSLGYTTNITPHRVVAFVTYTNTWIGKLNTTMNLFYTGASTGRMSYVYALDFNRDGNNTNNDLIYVPKDASEIQFVDIAAGNNNYGGVGYTAQQQSDIFFDLIDNDSYLKTRKGKYAERNGGVMPWRNQFDFRLTQELFKNIGGGNNSLEFFWDVINIGNLFNSNWGVYKSASTQLLRPQNTKDLSPDGTVKPTFQLNYNNGDVIRSTTYVNETISSTYYMQFGVKFRFN